MIISLYNMDNNLIRWHSPYGLEPNTVHTSRYLAVNPLSAEYFTLNHGNQRVFFISKSRKMS